METWIKHDKSEEEQITLLIAQEQEDLSYAAMEVMEYETNIRFLIRGEDTHEGIMVGGAAGDLLSGFPITGQIIMNDGRILDVIGSLEEFHVLGWRPCWWWYYKQFDHRVIGDSNDECIFTAELKASEEADLRYTKQWIERHNNRGPEFYANKRADNEEPDISGN